MSRWTSRIKDTWRRTDRVRAGLRAGARVGILVGSTVRAVNTAPLSPQPDVARSQPTALQRQVDREAASRLRDYGTYEVNRMADQQRDLVRDLPNRAAAERTSRAVDQTRGGGRGAGGRKQGRGR